MKRNCCLIVFLTCWSCAFSKSSVQNTTTLDQNVATENFKLPSKLFASNYSGEDSGSLAKVLNIYNVDMLAREWSNLHYLLTSGCRKDLDIFLESLKSAEKWALKMEDASGRYTTGWYWGNNYWSGSKSLCDNIAPLEKTIVVNSTNRAPDSNKKPSPSQTLGYKSGPMDQSSFPPFALSFFTLRLHLNSTVTSEEKLVYLGLCLPAVCTDKDVQILLENVSKRSKVDVTVEAVRSHHTHFYIWQDTTFIALCAITSFAFVCLLIGTSYDYYQEFFEKTFNMPAVSHGKTTLFTISNNNNNNNNSTTSESLAGSRSTFEEPLERQRRPHLKSILKLVIRETIMSFSLRANIKSICDQSVSPDTLPVIHGLKTISMAWVILGHTCIIAFKYSDNMEYRKVVQRDFFFQTISNGAFSVDSFFFTSGLLVSFLYFRTDAKGKLDPITKGHSKLVAGFAHFFGLIFYRFARLTMPYLFTLGLVDISMKWFNYNSIFEPPANDHVNCAKYWWRNVLYINTLFPVDEMCMLWSWYLSDDTQFYIVGAVILIIAAKNFKISAGLLGIFMISSWFTTGYIAYSNSHIPTSDDPLALFDKIYDKPWTRLGPYLIGMCCGWFLFKKNCQVKMAKITVILGWLLSLSCLFALVYGLYQADLSPFVGAAHSALSHSAWALSLSWIVIACVTGYGGFANTILSAPILYPFSRITYCAYLIHPIVMRTMIMTMDSPVHLGTLITLTIFLGQVVASYAISFVVSLAFEAPVVGMLRIMAKVFPPAKKEQQFK